MAIGNGSVVTTSNEVSIGSDTIKRRLTNIGDGELSATSTDAVTGKQLFNAMKDSGAGGVQTLRKEVDYKIDEIQNEVSDIRSEVTHVGSLSAALAGLHPMQYDPKAPAQVMAALGHYRSKQSVAVGLGYYFNDRFMMTAGVAVGSEKRIKSMANIGFTLKLGKGSGVVEEDSAPINNEVKKLNFENKELKSKVEIQDEKIKKQDEKIKNLEEKLEKILNK